MPKTTSWNDFERAVASEPDDWSLPARPDWLAFNVLLEVETLRPSK